MKRVNINWWKWAFLTMCSILAIFAIFFIVNMYQASREPLPLHMSEVDYEGANFTIVTTKEDINYWLREELLKEQEGSNVEYHLFLDDKVYLQTRVKVYGMTVPFQLVLEPIIQGNGDLLLKEYSFQVGDFSLPSSFIFQMVHSMIDLPDWMFIQPEEEVIYLNLREDLFDSLQIEVIRFDLEEDEIEFSLTFL